MDSGETQRPSPVGARPATAEQTAVPVDPRAEPPTGGAPRPRPGQPGRARQRANSTGSGATGNGAKGNGAKASGGAKGNGAAGSAARAGAKAKPGAPKKRPAPATQFAPPDAASVTTAVAVVEADSLLDTGVVDTSSTFLRPPTIGAEADIPVPTEARVPVELPAIVPAEPDLPLADVPTVHPGPTVQPVPTVTVWPDGAPASNDLAGDTDGTAGLPSLRKPVRPARALKAPKVLPRPRRPRVRKVTRVVRHVDTWSVFKVALVFNAFAYAVCLVAGVLLWQVAQNTGTVDNVERFFETFGWESFELKGGEIYHAAWVAGLFVGVGGTGLIVLAATLFNLITDLVGGIRVTVLEEEVAVRDERGLGWRLGRRRAPAAPTDSGPQPG